MMNITSKQKLIDALIVNFQENAYYFAGGLAISFAIGDNYELIWGVWSLPLFFAALYIYFFLVKYVPNLRADKELGEWRGNEYFDELERQLRSKTYRQLLREDWFCQYLKQKEKDDPPSVTKFMK